MKSSLGGGLPSFLCWTFKPYFTQTRRHRDHHRRSICATSRSRRIYLDNIPRIRTSVLTQNERALEGLRYGADDFDLPIEDEVTQKAGATISLDFDRLLEPRPHLRLHARIPACSSRLTSIVLRRTNDDSSSSNRSEATAVCVP